MNPVQLDLTTQRISKISQPQQQKLNVAAGGGFGQALQVEMQKQPGLKISAHAQKRLDQRNVHLDSSDHQRLNNAVDRIQKSGSDKSLVLMDNLALVVSARNRVVITALDSNSAKDGVFTNIDSAVIA